MTKREVEKKIGWELPIGKISKIEICNNVGETALSIWVYNEYFDFTFKTSKFKSQTIKDFNTIAKLL